MKMIQFGSENGCSKAGNKVRPFQIKLNSIFFNEENADYAEFRTLEGLSIIFRVSGKNKDFIGEGPERLQKSSGRNFVTIDLVIPQSRWLESNTVEFGKYLSKGIKDCFNLLERFADELGEISDKNKLEERFLNGIMLFDEFCGN